MILHIPAHEWETVGSVYNRKSSRNHRKSHFPDRFWKVMVINSVNICIQMWVSIWSRVGLRQHGYRCDYPAMVRFKRFFRAHIEMVKSLKIWGQDTVNLIDFKFIRPLPSDKFTIERSENFRNPRGRNHAFERSERHRIRVLERVLVSFEVVRTSLNIPESRRSCVDPDSNFSWFNLRRVLEVVRAWKIHL